MTIQIPSRIAGLQELASNLSWSWNREARALFAAIDDRLWLATRHNPVTFLTRVSAERLEACAANPAFRSLYDEAMHWSRGEAQSFMVFLNGDAIPEPDQRGERVVDDSFVIAFNAHHEPMKFTIPGTVYGDGWLVQLDTSDDQVGIVSVFDDATTLEPGLEFTVTERSVIVLRRPVAESRP